MCVAWHDMKALWEKCNDMNQWSRCSGWSSVLCSSLSAVQTLWQYRHRPYRTALSKKKKVCWRFCSLQSKIQFIRFCGFTEKGRFGWGSQSTLTLVVSLGWKAGQKQERTDGIAWHTSIVFGRVTLVEKKRKLFIGLVPSVFLWNVIITQAGHIYCIYRQCAGVAGAYYFSIFSQLNL